MRSGDGFGFLGVSQEELGVLPAPCRKAAAANGRPPVVPWQLDCAPSGGKKVVVFFLKKKIVHASD